MKIFKIEPIRPQEEPDKFYFGHDTQQGVVVRARDEQQARELAAEAAGGKEWERAPWLDSTITACEIVTNKGPAGVILRDYLAG